MAAVSSNSPLVNFRPTGSLGATRAPSRAGSAAIASSTVWPLLRPLPSAPGPVPTWFVSAAPLPSVVDTSKSSSDVVLALLRVLNLVDPNDRQPSLRQRAQILASNDLPEERILNITGRGQPARFILEPNLGRYLFNVTYELQRVLNDSAIVAAGGNSSAPPAFTINERRIIIHSLQDGCSTPADIREWYAIARN